MRMLFLVVFLAMTAPAFGIHMRVHTERVPVTRLIGNLEKIARDNPGSAEALLNLGRAHGMAYAQKSDPLNVPKAYQGVAPPAVPFNPVMTAADTTASAVAQTHLQAALNAYRRALALDEKNLVIRLGLAWLTEQAGRKEDAVRQYRAIATDAWEQDKNLPMRGFGGYSLTGEVASYLVPLLDAEKDKHEIERLNHHLIALKKLSYPVTPIAVPLADGLTANDIEAPDARVTFDVDGSGLNRAWSWITPKGAWLVFDAKRDGKITSGRQLFGNVTFWMFWRNGYGPLAALDDNRDGILTGKELEGFALWHDANGNGVADPGEVKPLSAYGVVAISHKWRRLNDHPDKIAFSPDGVVFQNGKTRPTFDLILRAQPGLQAAFRPTTLPGDGP